jgi:hypothetical protein
MGRSNFLVDQNGDSSRPWILKTSCIAGRVESKMGTNSFREGTLHSGFGAVNLTDTNDSIISANQSKLLKFLGTNTRAGFPKKQSPSIPKRHRRRQAAKAGNSGVGYPIKIPIQI